jgi:hypothetical protein
MVCLMPMYIFLFSSLIEEGRVYQPAMQMYVTVPVADLQMSHQPQTGVTVRTFYRRIILSKDV